MARSAATSSASLEARASQIDALLADRDPAYMGKWLTKGQYQNPTHIQYFSNLVADRLAKGGWRGILCAPPRHGKSEFTNVKLPGWYLKKDPSKRVILGGHSATFAATWGRKTRDYLCEFYSQMGVRINGMEDAAMDEWYTKEGGGMRTAGVGVGITGLGADLFIIDDPTPDSKAAWSSSHQEELKDWYQGVVDRRLEPHASVLVTMQRWPGNDFVSWLMSMKDQGRDQWEIINMAALYDNETAKYFPDPIGRDPDANDGLGTPLWPERWSLEELMKKMRTSENIDFWYSQYQQRPPDKRSEGLSYHSYSPVNSIVPDEEAKIDLAKPVLWFMDFNVDPMTSLIAQTTQNITFGNMSWLNYATAEQQKDLKITVIDEIFLRNSSTQAACRAFTEKLKPLIPQGRKIDVIVHGDASGKSAKSTSESDYKVLEVELRSTGLFNVRLSIPGKNPPQKDRVATVNNAFLDVMKIRRLFIAARCIELRRDLLHMKWRRNVNGVPTNDLDDSNPLRGHISDALGYGCWGLLRMKSKIGEKSERLL